MRTWWIISLMPVVTALASFAFAEPPFKADFERGEGASPAGWQFLQQRGRCQGVWDPSEPPPGGRSIRMDIGDDATARATWTYAGKVAIKPSTSYRLCARIMLAEVASAAKAYLIAYENGVQAATHWHMTPSLKGTRDWRTYEIRFTTRPDAAWLGLQCKLWDGAGHAWFDDIVLEELKPSEVIASLGQQPLLLCEALRSTRAGR